MAWEDLRRAMSLAQPTSPFYMDFRCYSECSWLPVSFMFPRKHLNIPPNDTCGPLKVLKAVSRQSGVFHSEPSISTASDHCCCCSFQPHGVAVEDWFCTVQGHCFVTEFPTEIEVFL